MRALLVLAALGLVGCDGFDSFTLHFSWSTDVERQSCHLDPAEVGPISCHDITVSCEVRARVRIVDDSNDQQLYSGCFVLENTGDLCGLARLPLPELEIPNKMVRIQVQVWSADQLADLPADGPLCPTDLQFDAFGLPRLDMPTPAVGAELYFPVGDREVAELELSCPDRAQLDTSQCRNRTLTVSASVLVPDSGRSVTATEATDLEVSFGEPREGDDGFTHLARADLDALELVIGASEPEWLGVVDGLASDGLRCLHVRDGEAGSTPIASCQLARIVPTASIDITGYKVELTQITKLTTLTNQVFGGAGFPVAGIVLGLAVDSVTGLPAAGVTVSPSSGHVVYPNATLTGVEPGGATGSNGLFLSIDTPIDTSWFALGNDGTVSDASARGGLIADHVTIVVVKMHAPSSSAP